MKNKNAAMELTMGTMVTIVLLVMVLILGGYFVNKIFFSATKSIDAIDAQVTDQINKLFAEDKTRKLVIYPSTRQVSLEKGEQGDGFAFAIRNTGTETANFTYNIQATQTSCQDSLTPAQADSFFATGKDSGTRPITIPAGSIMDFPQLVTFNIPDGAPPCTVSYLINVQKSGQTYLPSVNVVIIIESD